MYTIGKRTIGVNFNAEGMAEVSLWAPLHKKASVLINDTIRLDLLKEEYGYWQITTGQLKPGDRYLFMLDGEKPLPDPASLSQPDGVHGASQAIDLAREWNDTGWKNSPLEEYIIYELHTGTFTANGTFYALEEKLSYLKQLGITAIELMPVAQFPGSNNWGYDGVFPFAVQHSYGGAKALQHLIDACHQNGLAVILDVVYNHIGPEGNQLGLFAPYFTGKYKTPWGDAINFDDACCDGVRQFFIENALMWLRDFHIDALRLDAIHTIKDFSPNHFLRELKEHVNELMKLTGHTHYLIAECDLNDTRFIEPLEQKGYGLDAQWIDEFHHALRVTTRQDKNGYYCDFNGLVHLAKSYKNAYVYDGLYSLHRQKIFGTKTDQHNGRQFVVFSQNHDHIGNRMLGERTSSLVCFEQQKLMSGAVMVSPYLPLLFMGEEYGETNPFLYFIDHSDAALCETVRNGRREEFQSLHAQIEAPDPADAGTFNRSKLQWELVKNEPHKTLLDYYTALIALRKKFPVLHHTDRSQLNAIVKEETQTLLLHRWHDSQHAACLMNFSSAPQWIHVPDCKKNWKNIFDSASPQWNGPGEAAAVAECGKPVKLHPHSIVVYTNCYV